MRNERQPDGDQKVLEPAGGKSVDPLVHAVGVVFQAESAAGAHVTQKFFERREQSDKLLVDPPEEYRTCFLGEDRRVLRGKHVPPAGRVVLEITCIGHRAEPLAHIPLVCTGPLGQFGTGARAARSQVLE
jgi:hypothetical protein